MITAWWWRLLAWLLRAPKLEDLPTAPGGPSTEHYVMTVKVR